MGNRVWKETLNPDGELTDKQYYVRDASGNVMAMYRKHKDGTDLNLSVEEYNLFGSERVGVEKTFKQDVYNGSSSNKNPQLTTSQTQTNFGVVTVYPLLANRTVGLKSYELKDHLGNVRVVVSDRKEFDGTLKKYTPQIISLSDYYAFGSQMPKRNASSNEYRYGFNGQEKDDEIAGNGNSMTAEFWQYDSRIGRRWNLDPMAHKMPSYSPYAVFFNNPITIRDPNGDFGIAGFFIGFAVDVGVQMLANAIAGNPLGDIDYLDAFVSGVVGAVTGGAGNIGKLGRSAQKLLTAANINGKVASTVIKVTSVITEEGIKASIDIKIATKEGEFVELKTIMGTGEYAKGGADAAMDFAIGSTMTVFKGGATTVMESTTHRYLKQEEKIILRELKQSTLGGKKNLEYKAKFEQIGEDIKFESKAVDNIGTVASGAGSVKLKEELD